jgi:hypothetical protein
MSELDHQRWLIPECESPNSIQPLVSPGLRQDIELPQQPRLDLTHLCVGETSPDTVLWAIREWVENLLIIVRKRRVIKRVVLWQEPLRAVLLGTMPMLRVAVSCVLIEIYLCLDIVSISLTAKVNTLY